MLLLLASRLWILNTIWIYHKILGILVNLKILIFKVLLHVLHKEKAVIITYLLSKLNQKIRIRLSFSFKKLMALWKEHLKISFQMPKKVTLIILQDMVQWILLISLLIFIHRTLSLNKLIIIFLVQQAAGFQFKWVLPFRN